MPIALSIGDAIAVLDWAKGIVFKIKENQDLLKREEYRALLAQIYFSRETLEALNTLIVGMGGESQMNAARQISKRLWDTRIPVGDALDQLDQALDKGRFGLRGSRLVDEIRYAKRKLRKTLADVATAAVKTGSIPDAEGIRKRILDLNSTIEALDYEIGGILSVRK
ncbi:MAG: hypothetical protein H0T56_11570 [Pseudaminobacter sp.]|nr:hypothetical protein [Pseudaminobacter sp.]